jgi:UDP-N-acetylglucosamine 1-carboxyvinyltransferase
LDRFEIEGGIALRGRVAASGSKNAVLALMAASLLTDEEIELRGVPRLRDVETMIRILAALGVGARFDPNGRLELEGGAPRALEAPYDLVRTMRASFVVLGPLVARYGRARVSLPGGCAIGARPVDQHLRGLAALGAKIDLRGGYVEAVAPRLRGARIDFEVRTVGGTQNVLMAACLARGTSELRNAACEPEVGELVRVLRAMGARIEGEGTDRLVIEGVDELHGLEHRVSADRIEVGTLLAAAAITGGDVEVTGVRPTDLASVLERLAASGVEIDISDDAVRARRTGELRAIDLVTRPFPGFPTDMQAQMMAVLALASGESLVTETIFENRFMHVPELRRLGAEIAVEGNTARIRGVAELFGAPVMATDLRASASLVLGGLAARGRTTVRRVYHIDRGYAQIERKLCSLGARVWRESE